MIPPVLPNTKRCALLALSFLSIALSIFSIHPLAASNDFIPSEENNGRGPQGSRNGNNQENLDKMKTPHQAIGLPDDAWERVFKNLPYKAIRAARCASKIWNEALSGDVFCFLWGRNFAPYTPSEMGMTPQKFIHYWSTPSLTFDDELLNLGRPTLGLSTDVTSYDQPMITLVNGQIMLLPHLKKGYYAEPTGVNWDGSIIVGHARNGTNYAENTAVQWVNGKIMPLSHLNNGRSAEAIGVNWDGSIIVGKANDGANGNKITAVLWANGKIMPLSHLNNGGYESANSVNWDGSIIVGFANDGANNLRGTAVLWVNGEIFSVSKILETTGLKLGENHLVKVLEISANGLQVIGQSYGGDTVSTFKAVLPSKYSW